MRCFAALFLFLYLIFSLLVENNATQTRTDGIYIVYMGAAAAAAPNVFLRDDHAQLENSLINRKQNAVVHTYKNGFSGFAARLSKEEAESIAQRPGVVSVFPDSVFQLHTTRSWDFLRLEADVDIKYDQGSTSHGSESDSIIAIIDTGIWPESESFNDKNMGPIPSKWKGTCMEAKDFNSSLCNRKLIGARYYPRPDDVTGSSHTPRDANGHGTHVASTAAGSAVAGASYYGLAAGTAKGGSPSSRIAAYRVCPPGGCFGSAILAAFDDAIGDGVDVISISIGSSAGGDVDFSKDPISIGAFHAVDRGITVICSAGNEGPLGLTVVNVAPWFLTVAATTIDRDYQTNVVLGGQTVIQGGAINFGSINTSPAYPLIAGASANSGVADAEARNCNIASLDPKRVKGKIVLCEDTDDEYENQSRQEEVKKTGGVGLIVIDGDERQSPSYYYTDFPISVVTSDDGLKIFSYMNSTRRPVATILPTKTVIKDKPAAPEVAYFSARGPNPLTKSLLKPDIAAPGVNILAAWRGNDTTEARPGKEPPIYELSSGTSMACPHVSAIAAIIKSQHPTWGPSAIKSAIMTTASQTNNMKAPMRTNSGQVATPYDFGAGGLSTSRPMQPGLVYETHTADYLRFLCNLGYNVSKIKFISSSIPHGFSCPKNPSEESISNMNYPSIAISKFNTSRKVIRTVTNVGEEESLYTAAVEVPPNRIGVEVIPDKLRFTKKSKRLSYEVTFTAQTAETIDDTFGSITWTNGKHEVRSPFVVSYF